MSSFCAFILLFLKTELQAFFFPVTNQRFGMNPKKLEPLPKKNKKNLSLQSDGAPENNNKNDDKQGKKDFF